MSIQVSRPRWVKHKWTPAPVWRRECELVGLRSSYSAYPHAMIDASIARLIAKLNDAGLVTEYCCSGLKEDHRGDSGPEPIARQAYILFARPVPKSLVSLLPRSIYVEDDYPNAIRFTDKKSQAKLRLAWEDLEARVDLYLRAKERGAA